VEPETPGAFESITQELGDLRREAELEQLGEARETVAAGLAGRPFADELRRIGSGDVVTVATVDGQPLRGRVLGVGADWVRIGEVTDESGARRARLRRVHDVRLAAVVRLTREDTG
jgi:hypothetical protein